IMTITVVGGVYYERSMHPSWNEQFGSGGRAAIALAASGADVSPVLYSYVDTTGAANFHAIAVAAGVNFIPYMIPDRITFHYTHGLATPEIRPWGIEQRVADALQVRAERLIRFGFIEGDAVVHGDFVVYDPQNVQSPPPFAANGSTANHLALVLNQYEAAVMSGGRASPEAMAKAIAEDQNAEVVIIKLGPYGAMVYHQGQF